MPLNPKYQASHVLQTLKSASNPLAHTVEFFVDYNCPFAAKLIKKVQDELVPQLKTQGLDSKYKLVFVNMVQPWHGFQSSVLHEAGLAVAQVDPSNFWRASRVLFDNIETFYDSEVYDLSKRQLVEKVAGVLSENLANVEQSQLVELVQTSFKQADGNPSNMGSLITKDIKYFTRYARTIGVHVSPSVVLNGIYLTNIESSTPVDTIIEILESQTN